MLQKVAKSIGKYFGHYQNFVYFPHWVQQYTYLCCNSIIFPLNFGSLAVKNNGIFQKFRHSHTSYCVCV